jgi:hypothetical protein
MLMETRYELTDAGYKYILSTFSLFDLVRVVAVAANELDPAKGSLRDHFGLILELTYCRSVDYYLLYISELLSLMFQAKPDALRASESSVKMNFILEFDDYKELLDAMTEKTVQEFSFKGLKALSEDLVKKLSLPLFSSDADLTRAIAIVECRNLFIHNRGTINRTYLSRVKNSDKRLGAVITLTVSDVISDPSFLANGVIDTDNRASQKFGLPKRRDIGIFFTEKGLIVETPPTSQSSK